MNKFSSSGMMTLSNPLFGYVILLIIVAYLVSKVGKNISGFFSGADNTEREDTLADPDEENLSYPLINYTTFANAIEVALEMYWDDEAQVNFVFEQMNNNDDVLQLMKSFGVRKASPLGIAPSYAGTLSEWLSFNLTGTEINDINDILDGKNITIRFA
tara:strand:- start:12501 stop:12974 length:474 start_codon:yes stop_codon:yes gene_type:complete